LAIGLVIGSAFTGIVNTLVNGVLMPPLGLLFGGADFSDLASCAGSTLVVTVTFQFQLTMPLVGTIIGTQNFPIAVSSSSTILRPAC
jgi:large-conductance mechanosensitive channel